MPVGKDSDKISTLSHQVAALVDRYNAQEDKIERLQFDIQFLQAWAQEYQRESKVNPRLDYMGRI